MGVMDQTRDESGRMAHELFALYDAPEFVKQASPDERLGDASVPARAYADTLGRRFPCHTKAACWTSAVFYLANRDAMAQNDRERIGARLEASIKFAGMESEYRRLEKRAAELAADPLAGLPNSEFAWVVRAADGSTRRRLPLRNDRETKAAADWLVRYRDQFRYADRRGIAMAILEKAAGYGTDLGESGEVLERVAGFGACSTSTAAGLVEQRARLLGRSQAGLAQELQKFAGLMRSAPEKTRNPSMLAKVAEIIDKVDRESGLDRQYGHGVDRPEDVLFLLNEKIARACLDEHVGLVNGSVYNKGDLSRLRTREVREYLGDDVADATTSNGVHVDVDKLAEVAATLPRGDADVLDRLCAAHGVSRVVKEAALQPWGLGRSDLEFFAGLFRPSDLQTA